jgi:hypothetical protein
VIELKLTKRKKLIAATAAVLALLFISVVTRCFSVCGYALGLKQNLLLTLKARQHIVRMNGSIDIVLTLINLGPKESVLSYRNSHAMDLFLYSLDGRLVSYFTKDCLFFELRWNIRLQPGEAKVWRISWNSFSENGVTTAGPYFLEGSVLYFETSRLPILILP